MGSKNSKKKKSTRGRKRKSPMASGAGDAGAGKRGRKKRTRRRREAAGALPRGHLTGAPSSADLIVLSRMARPDIAGCEPAALAREFLSRDGQALPGACEPPGAGTPERGIDPRLWERIREELLRLPLAVLTEAAWLVASLGDSLAAALADAEAEARSSGRDREDDLKPYAELLAERGEAMRKAMKERRVLAEPQPLDVDAVERTLAPGGQVSRALGGFEERPQQREMARAVATALGDGRHLMVEGGTGVGKSLAYLIPAALWARRTGRPVVVSTHTKNLQHQLFTKDLPLVQKVFAELASDAGGSSEAGGDLRVALIKGRGNYLCVRKLLRLLRTADQELDGAERVGLLSVLAWAVSTETGDLSENPAFEAGSPFSLRDKLTCPSDECRGRRCSTFGRCFLQRARAKSLEADVVIANHALVFSELGLDTPVLPPYQEVVFDEAQHVEDVATEHLAVRCSRMGVMRVLSRVFRTSRSGAGTGLVATAFEELARAEDSLPGGFALSAHGALSAAAEAVRPVSEKAEEFFRTAARLTGEGRGSRYKRRYDADSREGAAWEEVLAAGRALQAALVELAGLIETAAEAFSSTDAKPVRGRREIAQDLQAQAGAARELGEDLGFVLGAANENYVYWVEGERGSSRRGPFAELTGAPVAVAPILKEQLLSQKRSIVMTSATLTVADEFDYMASRLGLELQDDGADALAVGSPFNYKEQARVYVPRFLPDPRSEREFVAGLAPLVVELFALTQGSALALFTSYSMLEAAYEAAASPLAARGVRVLAQGRDGPRERILEELREGLGVAVFGTASFWEGVDVPGEALTALVVAKLPFHVHTDPLIQARCEALREAGDDPFNSYTLPAAVLRLRQGFGRLIRTKKDRGIVVIADPRVLRTGYGHAFVESLPVRVQAAPTPSSLIKAARKFLEETAPRADAGT